MYKLNLFELSNIGIALTSLKNLVFITLDKGETLNNRTFAASLLHNDKKLKITLSFEVEDV